MKTPVTMSALILYLIIFLGGICTAGRAWAVSALTLPAQQKFYSVSSSLSVRDGLSENLVQDLAVDEYNRFWVATQDGLNLLDANQIHTFLPGNKKSTLSGGFTYELLADGKGGVWVITNNGLDHIGVNDLSTTHIDAVPANGIKSLVLWDEEHIALLIDNQIHTINLLTSEIKQAAIKTSPVRTMVRAGSRLVLETQEGFYSVLAGKSDLQPMHTLPQFTDQVISFTADKQGALWIVTVDGNGYRCTKTDCQLVQLTDGFTEKISIGHVMAKDGDIYLASTQGLFMVTHTLESVWQLQVEGQNLFNEHSFHHELLVTEENDLLVGTLNGVYFLSSNFRYISSYTDNNPMFQQQLTAMTAIQIEEQEALAVAGTQNLFVMSTEGGQLRILDKFVYPSGFEPISFITSGHHRFLNSYRSGTLEWTSDGLRPLSEIMPVLVGNTEMLTDVYDFENGDRLLLFLSELMLFAANGAQYQLKWRAPLPADVAFSVMIHDGHLFVSTMESGLLIRPWSRDAVPTDWQTLSPELMQAGIRQIDEKLVLMTLHDGLWQVKQAGGAWQSVPMPDNDKLLNSAVMCLAPYFNKLWLASTNNGVAIFDNSFNLHQILTSHDGLGHRENFHFGCTSLDKATAVLGFRGISLFHQMVPRRIKPKLNWVGAWAEDEPVSLTQLADGLVSPRQLSFRVAVGPLPITTRTAFQYRLRASEGEWKQLDESLINLLYLAPGDYQFEVRAYLYDGSYTNSLTLPFEIAPPYWRQPPALMLYLLVALAIFAAILRARGQAQKERMALLQQQRDMQEVYTKRLELTVQQRTEELNRRQQEALRQQRDRIHFITGASHDLKNLVSLLRLNLGSPGNKKAGVSLDTLRDVSKNLNELTNNIVQLSKLDIGVIKPSYRAVNLASLLTRVHAQFSAVCQQKNIQFSIECQAGVTVSTDAHLLARLLHNVVDNAIKNLARGGHVKICVNQQESRYLVEIEDNGPGMPAEILKQWPEPFWRGTDKYTGSGLGLSVVKKLADLLEIPISIHHVEPTGTRFCLAVPGTVARSSNEQHHGPHLIAVIEDDKQQLTKLTENLAAKGYQVEGFSSLADFMAQPDRCYRAVVSDVDLSDLQDGIDALPEYQTRLTEGGVVIYVSGHLSAQRRISQLQGVHFLLKPIKLTKLYWLLRQGVNLE